MQDATRQEPANETPPRSAVDQVVRDIFNGKRGLRRPLLEYLLDRRYQGKETFTPADIKDFYLDRARKEVAKERLSSWEQGVIAYHNKAVDSPASVKDKAFDDGKRAAKEADQLWEGHPGKTLLRHLRGDLKRFFNPQRLSQLSPNKRPSIFIELSGWNITVCRRPGHRSPPGAASPKDNDLSIVTWNQKPLDALFQQLNRSTGRADLAGPDDLRIATSAFPVDKYPELELRELLLKKHLKIKIILTNPNRRELVWSRNLARKDKEAPQLALNAINYQYSRLSDPELFPPSTPEGGRFEVKLSNLMPLGFYALTQKKALLGLLWSQMSFSTGEFLSVDRQCPLWQTLDTDWTTRWEYDDHRDEREFNGFFGANAWSSNPHAERGVVILQSDRIENLKAGQAESPRAAVRDDVNGLHRTFKARRWVNRCDTDGVQAICGLFERLRINAPRLVFSDHSASDTTQIGNAPFEIVLGGFTSKTRTRINTIGDGWMQLKIRKDSGDTIYLRKDLVSATGIGVVAEGEFYKLLPRGWNPSYIHTWEAKISSPNDYEVHDYAVILRHTVKPYNAEGDHRVQIYLSGFTEVGTAAAAYFLAERWHDLWRDFVQKGQSEGTDGDFLLVIAGESNQNIVTNEWQIVEAVRIPVPTKTMTPTPKKPSVKKRKG
jgi:hypothetical protein